MRLAAQIAFLTWSGADAGAAAVPSAASFARLALVTGLVSIGTPAPPLSACAIAGSDHATTSERQNHQPACKRESAQTEQLLRLPTGLADGLALKELAPPPKWTRPYLLVPPLPADGQGLGICSITSAAV